MLTKKYRINDIARNIDRDKTTIIHWEKIGYIPKAQRDSRGWRYYSWHEVRSIVNLVKKTDYFQNLEKLSDSGATVRRISQASVAMIVLYMLYNLIQLGSHGQAVRAFTNQTTTMFTTVSAGILDIVSASSSNSFTGVNVSFSSQTATASKMGAFRTSDARGSGAGWVVNLACNDWKAGEDVMQIDCDGTGATGNLGKMCLIVSTGNIESIAGQSTASGFTKGALDCFGSDVSQIDIYTAASTYGKGDYWIKEFSMQQYIPSNPTAQNLTTTLVLTVS